MVQQQDVLQKGASIISPPAGLYADPLGDAVAATVPYPAPAVDGRARASSTAEDLSRFFDLKEKGAITQEEFDAFKAKLLQS